MEFKTYYSHSLIDLFCSDKRKSEVYNGCYCYQIVKYPNYSTLTLLDSYIFKKKIPDKKNLFQILGYMPNKDIPNSKNGQNNYELSHRAEPQKPLESRFFYL